MINNNRNDDKINSSTKDKCRLLILTAAVLIFILIIFIPSSYALSISNIQVFPKQTNVRINWNTDIISNGTIEVWEGSNVFTASHSSLLTTHTLTVTGLTPATRYLHKITSTSGSNSQTIPQQRFYTLVNPPQNLQIPLLEHDRAQITWTAPSGTDISYRVKLNGEIKIDENPFDTEIMLLGLEEMANYSVEVTSIDQFGNDGGTLKGIFTTPEEPLEISFVQVQPRSTSAVLTFRTNFPSKSIITYYPLDNEALTNTIEETQFKTEHSINLPSLLMETNYKVEISTLDEEGGTANAETTFTTLRADSEIVSITNIETSPVNATTVAVEWTTSHTVPSRILWSIDDSFDNFINTPAGQLHRAVLTNLLSGTTYNFKILAGEQLEFSSDALEFTTLSSEGRFLALDPTPDVTKDIMFYISGRIIPMSRIFFYLNNEENPQKSITTETAVFNESVILNAGARIDGVLGKNKIRIEAFDPQGNKDTKEINVIIDTTLPLLDVDPIPEFTNKNTINVSGLAEEGGVLEIILNNRSVYERIVENMVFSTIINLDQGVNSLLISITDNAGNINLFTRSIVLDNTAPSIELITDLSGESHFNIITIKGNTEPGSKIYVVNFGEFTGCDDPGFIEAFNRCDRMLDEDTYLPSTGATTVISPAVIGVQALGEVIETRADSSGDFTIEVPLFPDQFGGIGENNVLFVAEDRAGNIGKIERSIRYSPSCIDWTIDAGRLQVYPFNLYTIELRDASVEGSIFIPVRYTATQGIDEVRMNYYLDTESIRGQSFGEAGQAIPGAIEEITGEEFRQIDATRYVSISGEPTFIYDDAQRHAYFYAPLTINRVQESDLADFPDQLNVFLDLEINYRTSAGTQTCHLYPQASFSVQEPIDYSKWLTPEMINTTINLLDGVIDAAERVNEVATYLSYGGLGLCALAVVKSHLEAAFDEGAPGEGEQCTASQKGLELTYAICDRVMCPAAAPRCNELNVLVNGQRMDIANYNERILQNREAYVQYQQEFDAGQTSLDFRQWVNSQQSSGNDIQYTPVENAQFVVQGNRDENEDGSPDIYEIEYFRISGGRVADPRYNELPDFERSELVQKARECNPDEETLVRIRSQGEDPTQLFGTRAIGGYRYYCGSPPPDRFELPSNGGLPGCYNAECPQFDDTKCFGTDDINPPNGLFASIRCGCVTGFKNHLDNYITIMTAAKQCLESAREGNVRAGFCERLLAQFVCDLLNEFILKSLFGGSSRESILGDILFDRDLDNYRERSNAISEGISDRYSGILGERLGLSSDQLVNKWCVAAISWDWSAIEGLLNQIIESINVAPQVAIDAYSRPFGYNPFTGKMSIGYNIIVGIVPGSDIENIELRLVCDRAEEGSQFCGVNVPPLRIAEMPSYIARTSGLVEVPIVFTDEESLWWYNVLELEMTYTLGGEIVHDVIRENIRQKGELAYGCSFSLQNGITCDVINSIAARGGFVELLNDEQGSMIVPQTDVFYPGNKISALVHLRNNYQGENFYLVVDYGDARMPVQYLISGANTYELGIESYLLWVEDVGQGFVGAGYNPNSRRLNVNGNDVWITQSDDENAVVSFRIETEVADFEPRTIRCDIANAPEYGVRFTNRNEITSLPLNVNDFRGEFCNEEEQRYLHDDLRGFCDAEGGGQEQYERFVRDNLRRKEDSRTLCVSQYDYIGDTTANNAVYGSSLRRILETNIESLRNDATLGITVEIGGDEQRIVFERIIPAGTQISGARVGGTRTRSVIINVMEDSNNDEVADTVIPYSEGDLNANQQFTLRYEIGSQTDGSRRPIIEFIEPLAGVSHDEQRQRTFHSRTGESVDTFNREEQVPLGFVIVDDANDVQRLTISIASNREFACSAEFIFDNSAKQITTTSGNCDIEVDERRTTYFNPGEPSFVSLLWNTDDLSESDKEADVIYEVTATVEDLQTTTAGSNRISRRFRFDPVEGAERITADQLKVCLGGGTCNYFSINRGGLEEQRRMLEQTRGAQTGGVQQAGQIGQQGGAQDDAGAAATSITSEFIDFSALLQDEQLFNGGLEDFENLGGIYVPEGVDPDNAQVMFLFHGLGDYSTSHPYLFNGNNFNEIVDEHVDSGGEAVILVELIDIASNGNEPYNSITAENYQNMFDEVNRILEDGGINVENANYNFMTHSYSSGLLAVNDHRKIMGIEDNSGNNINFKVIAMGESSWRGTGMNIANFAQRYSDKYNNFILMLTQENFNKPDSDVRLIDRNSCREIQNIPANYQNAACVIANFGINHNEIPRELFREVLSRYFRGATQS